MTADRAPASPARPNPYSSPSPDPGKLSRRGAEAWWWVFMRVSGIALVFLALTHFALTHIVNDVVETDYRFVSERWENPFWQLFDWALLVLALVHGANGVRVIVNDYVSGASARRAVRSAVYLAVTALAVLGTFTIVTFNGQG